MKHCPKCGSVNVVNDNRCGRESCGHTTEAKFPSTSQFFYDVPGVAISSGGYWIRPHKND